MLGNLGSAGKGSEGRPGERRCGRVAAWKPRVALRFSINLHSVSNSSCVTPSSMAYGIVIHSQCKCLVLRGKLVSFIAVHRDECLFPCLSLLISSRNVALLGRHKKPWPYWLVLQPPECMGIQRGISFCWCVISVRVSLKDVVSSTGGKIPDQESF